MFYLDIAIDNALEDGRFAAVQPSHLVAEGVDPMAAQDAGEIFDELELIGPLSERYETLFLDGYFFVARQIICWSVFG